MFLQNSELNQYESILVDQNKETNPIFMLNGALYLHSQGYYFPAFKMYEVLLSLIQSNYGSKEFKSTETKQLIMNSIELAKFQKQLDEKTLSKINYNADINHLDQICSKPAQLFMTLGYFDLSGNLFECAYTLNTKNSEYAIQSLESFYLTNNYSKLNQMLSIINTIEKK